MAEPTPPHRSPLAWAVALLLLLIGIAATLIVPIYARSTPKLGDFPFFYWYQLILVPVIAILAWLAYLLVRSRPGAGPANGGGASS
jgi:hypothetical protein